MYTNTANACRDVRSVVGPASADPLRRRGPVRVRRGRGRAAAGPRGQRTDRLLGLRRHGDDNRGGRDAGAGPGRDRPGRPRVPERGGPEERAGRVEREVPGGVRRR